MLNFSNIFRDGMILPSGKPFSVYGEGRGEIHVSLEKDGRIIETSVYSDRNRFFCEMPAVCNGGPYELTVADADNKITFKNVYFGIVILVSGQSNAQFKVCEGEDVLEPVNDDLLRLFTVNRITFFDGDKEYYRSKDGWISLTEENMSRWSSIGCQVGLELRKKYDCPVGIIACYQGASVIQSWLPKESFEGGRFDLPVEKLHSDHYDPIGYYIWNGRSTLYNLVFGQVRPYSVSGVVWYQGESNTTVGEGEIYDDELVELVNVWRADLHDEKLPFVIVQIADLDCRNDDGWRAIQDAQERAVGKLDNAALAVSKDISDTWIIHPPKKKLLCGRIAHLFGELTENGN